MSPLVPMLDNPDQVKRMLMLAHAMNMLTNLSCWW
jgi:hypothetical protein